MDKMMKTAVRYIDKNGIGRAAAMRGDEFGRPEVLAQLRTRDRAVTALSFGEGTSAPKVDDMNQVNSFYVDVSRYKSLEIFVQNRVSTTLPSEISFAVKIAGQETLMSYFDWNKENWVTSVVGQSPSSVSIPVPYNHNRIYALSTHPDFYWLKDFKGDEIQLRFKPQSQPNPNNDNYLRVWIVGELNE